MKLFGFIISNFRNCYLSSNLESNAIYIAIEFEFHIANNVYSFGH